MSALSLQDEIGAALCSDGSIDAVIDALDRKIDDAANSPEELLDAVCARASFGIMRGEEKHFRAALLQRCATGTRYERACKSFVEGAALLCSGISLVSAMNRFKDALEDEPHFLVAHLGIAAVHIIRRDLRAAFTSYKICLERLGNRAPPLVRSGLGICSMRLKQVNHAERCFARALQLDPRDELALIGMTAVHLHRHHLSKATETITTLFDVAPENPVVAQRFVDIMHIRAAATGEVLQHAPLFRETIRRSAAAAPPGSATAAYSTFQEARLAFACGEYDEARLLYQQAIQVIPTLQAARIQLARLEFKCGNTTRAVELLEQMLQEPRFQREALQMLAVHYSMTQQHQRAIRIATVLSRAAAPDDPSSFAISAWCNRHDADTMLEELRVYNVLRKNLDPTAELDFHTRANCAALRRDVDELRQCAAAALEVSVDAVMAAEAPVPPFDAAHIPLLYNLALSLHERGAGAAGESAAKRLYCALIKQHPTFTPPYHHLIASAIDAQRLEEAQQWLRLLRAAAPADPYLVIDEARLLVERGQREQAARLLSGSDSRCVPVAIAAGKLYLNGAQARTSRRHTHLQVARDRFVFALSRDPSNVLAAHGLVCCAAATAAPNAATTCFDEILKTVPTDARALHDIARHRFGVMVKADQHKLAVAIFREASAASVSDACALAYCFACEGNYDRALQTMNELLAAQPHVEELRRQQQQQPDGTPADDARAAASAEVPHFEFKPGTDAVVVYNSILAQWLVILDQVAKHSFLPPQDGAALKAQLHRVLAMTKAFLSSLELPTLRSEGRRFVRGLARQGRAVQSSIVQLIAKGRVEEQRQQSESSNWVRRNQQRLEEIAATEARRREEETRRRDAAMAASEARFAAFSRPAAGNDAALLEGLGATDAALSGMAGTSSSGLPTPRKRAADDATDDADEAALLAAFGDDEGDANGVAPPVPSASDVVSLMMVSPAPGSGAGAGAGAVSVDGTLLVDSTLAAPSTQ